MAEYQLANGGVVRTSDGAMIPAAAGNRDWRRYQEWLNAGGVPDSMPVVAVLSIADHVENRIKGNSALIALVRRMAKKEGITEQALIDEIKSEAKEP